MKYSLCSFSKIFAYKENIYDMIFYNFLSDFVTFSKILKLFLNFNCFTTYMQMKPCMSVHKGIDCVILISYREWTN